MSLLDRLRRGGSQRTTGKGRRDPLDPTLLPQDLRALATEHLAWVRGLLAPLGKPGAVDWSDMDWSARYARDAQMTQELRQASDEQRRAAVAYAFASFQARRRVEFGVYVWGPEEMLLSKVVKRRLAWTPAQVAWLLESTVRLAEGEWRADLRELIRVPLMAAERLPEVDRGGLAGPLQRLLVLADAEESGWENGKERTRVVERIRALVPAAAAATGPATIPASVLHDGDTFGARARTVLLGQFAEPSVARVLTHLTGYGTTVAPTRAWRAATARLSAAEPATAPVARTLLTELLTHRESPVLRRWGEQDYEESVFVHPDTAELARAATWVVAAVEEAWVTGLLGDLAVHCGTGLGGSGGMARCAPVANSAIAALAERAKGGGAAAVDVVAQLARVQAKVANKTIRKGVDRALQAAAEAAGMSPGELLERAVPDFGLDPDGAGERAVGDYTALLTLGSGPAGATLAVRWRTPAGRETASVPAAVKEQHPDELAELRALAKEAKKAAATQRARLEDLLAVDRTWSGADWVAHYVGHPVVGLYARALLWQARPAGAGEDAWAAGLPERDGTTWALRGHAEHLVAVGPGDEVRLWHPIREPLAEVRAWREHLTDRAFRQPFKQAFREIYLLTPAEEDTGTYSNRFAAHILRYPQAGALMRTRGWAGNHLGYWDGGAEGEAVKVLGESSWRAWFFYDLVENDTDNYETPALCSTDQVRFEQWDGPRVGGGWTTRPLAQVPPLILSEAMRDVDLFVGVAGIAADPTWVDRGDNRYRDYWYQASFGDLTESAQVRREALERLLPRTKLAGRAELAGKFLVVHGHLRDYKIHLGSGNILMSPADSYLCIVPARGEKAPQVFLPFEEDGGKLAVILSKAFLLAEDTAITDRSITQQLRRGLPG